MSTLSTFPVTTFSIVARNPLNDDLGVATASKFLAVGAVVPGAEAEVGAIATQSYANTSYVPRALAALRAGIPLAQIHQAFAATDEHHSQRQYGLVDASGDSVTFTGDDCHPWAGGISRENVAAQGNLLVGSMVIEELISAFESSREAFPERLLTALVAGDRAGGDRRGRQSAALLVVRRGGGYGGLSDRYIDLRVDDHVDPVAGLRRLLELQRLYFERPREEDVLVVEGEIAERLTRVLVAAGRLDGERPWGPISEKALRELAGIENLEERMLDEGRIDRVVLTHLERLFGR